MNYVMNKITCMYNKFIWLTELLKIYFKLEYYAQERKLSRKVIDDFFKKNNAVLIVSIAKIKIKIKRKTVLITITNKLM